MSGILDSKTRIFDTILTPEGRRQLAQGNLRATFYSFTDSGAVYAVDTIVSGSGSVGPDTLDATFRFTLESSGLPQDSITFESDDAGRLVAFPASGSSTSITGSQTKFIILDGQVFSGSNLVSGSTIIKENLIKLTGSQFTSLSKDLLNNSINAFRNQMILRSPDPVDEKDREFLLGQQKISFNIGKERPFAQGEVTEANINHIEGLFQDKRLSSIPNFKFLAPVNKIRPGAEKRTRIANYMSLNQADITSMQDLEAEFRQFESVEIPFTETSRENNLVCQFFESSQDRMIKLEVIDFGTLRAEDGSLKHVFFVGKVFIDDYNCPTFVNIFSLVFS